MNISQLHSVVERANNERRKAIDGATNTITLEEVMKELDTKPRNLSEHQRKHYEYGDILEFKLQEGAYTAYVQRVSMFIQGQRPENNDVLVEFQGQEVLDFYQKIAQELETQRKLLMT